MTVSTTPPAADQVQEALTDWCPEYRASLLPSPGDAVLPATSVLDPAWLTARVAESARRYRTADPRVAAVLWWYSASTVLLTPALATLAVTRWAVDPRPAATTLHLRRDGLPSGARSSDVVGNTPESLGAALGEAVQSYVGALAEVAPVRPRAAWAIAVDSVSGALLRAGTTIGEPTQATALAAPLIAAAGRATGERPPPPRFVDVNGARFVRRASCCLLYRAPGQPMCTSCPARRPDERREDLARLATAMGGRRG
ncbi:(2Fe-2S)-binding protein [Yinghuangia seranimata]|uniref:(2Fe-2S)-binding protein n=1 Tax=Yinghuangia seranimata TaxID=408067 RepID=UPI00248C45BA|nr:(2Fe-2S)-binding protein [Yinghuangia seranimata]MDI2125299.1 (2Fe-2S)-binding protein [Yinghuangia seranimata]